MAGKVLRIDDDCLIGEAAGAASSVLRDGGTVIYPSDTVYGILADCSDRVACMKVASSKGYQKIRPFIVLVPDIKTALSLVSAEGTDSARLMHKYWPGPVTLVYRACVAVPEWLISKQGTVALRVPADALSIRILLESGKCLITTSANLKEKPFPLSLKDISEQITSSVDLILNGGTLVRRKPSKVLDCTAGTPVELR